MGRIFLIALVIFLAFNIAGWLFGFLLTLLKWGLIVALAVVAFGAVKRLVGKRV